MATQQIDLPVTGMTCASCVRTVERALTKTEGVEGANVNLATERAHVEFDPAKTSVGDIIDRVSRAGYGVAQASIELPITGMTCASCVRNVERAVGKVPGILSVNVNLATEKASVTYLPGTVRRSDLIQAVVNNIQPSATQKNQQLTVEVKPDVGMLVADPVFIQEAIDNLLNNAIKYTPAGGRIAVHAYSQDNNFHFVVEDNGVGIGPEHLPHLFEAFYRAKQRGTETIEGTGLGLSLVKAAVERHQGGVWVESEVGKGSRFGFWLPLQPQKE
jgi:copper ion binding protein